MKGGFGRPSFFCFSIGTALGCAGIEGLTPVSYILWLASYPKSGNTWLRAFLANYLADARQPTHINALRDFAYGDMRVEYYEKISQKKGADLTGPEINKLRPRVHRMIAASQPGLVFVKTHSALTQIDDIPTITPEATFGAIYVVRNPMDVAVSFAHHNGLSIDDAVQSLCLDNLYIPAASHRIPQILTSWGNHVRTWKRAPGLNLKVVRYEDLAESPNKSFGGILDFLKVPKERERLKRALRFSSFKVLAEQEKTDGFGERSAEADRFFRKGRAGAWRDELSEQNVDTLISHHREVMEEMGYLSAAGEVLV